MADILLQERTEEGILILTLNRPEAMNCFNFDLLAALSDTIREANFDMGLRCIVIGLEDLIIDRMNACKPWRSEVDCEMAELLIVRYREELDWAYLEQRAALPENDTLAELRTLKDREAP